jgi:WD40 repeat protein
MRDFCDQVAWLGQGTRFAAASQSGELWVVDGGSMQVMAKILGPDPEYAHLGGLAAAPDGSRLFVSVGPRLGAFDASTGKVIWRVDETLYDARLTVSPDGKALVGASYDGIAFFDAATGQPGARFPFASPHAVVWPESDGGVFSKAEPCHMSWSPRPRFSPIGHSVAVQDHAGNLNFIDPKTGALYPTPRQQGCAWIEDLAWFPDGQHVALGMSDDSLAFWKASPLTSLLHVQAIGAPQY